MNPRLIAIIIIYLGVLVMGLGLARLSPDANTIAADPQIRADFRRSIAVITFLYMATTAIPFVPGAEIGLGLLAAFGSKIAPLVWLAMLGALCITYAVGRMLSPVALARLFNALGMARAARLVEEVAVTPKEDRVRMLTARAPHGWVATLVRHRYLALALALNLPGNAVLGGGGGLALVAGMSGVFAPLPFGLTVALASAPLPTFVWVTGTLF